MMNMKKLVQIATSAAFLVSGIIGARAAYACPTNQCTGGAILETVNRSGAWPGELDESPTPGDRSGGYVNGTGTTLFVLTPSNTSTKCIDGWAYVNGSWGSPVEAGYGTSASATTPGAPSQMYLSAVVCEKLH